MSRMPFLTLLIAIVIILVYGMTERVKFSERAVRVTLGRASEESVISKPGLYFRWPPPIEFIRTYDVRLHTTDTPESEIKTRDGKNLIVSCYLLWQIEDPYKFYVRVKDVGEAERQLRTRVGQIRSAAIGKRDMSFFVNLDEQTVSANYVALEEEMLTDAAASILNDYGIVVKKIGIRRISLPEQVTETVFKAMIANANKQATTYREVGKAKAEEIRARANSDRRQILAFADAKAEEIRSTGVQASTNILSQIPTEDRDFFEFLRQLEALEIALAEQSTIFLDSNSILSDVFINNLLGGDTTPRRAGREE